MENLLKSLYQDKINLSKEDEKEIAATKKLSEEYNRYYEQLINSLSPKEADQLNVLLDIEDELEALREEHRFIRYITFGAQLYRELIGDISCSGNVPFSAGIHGLFDEARPFQENIRSNSEAYKKAAKESETLAEELLHLCPEAEGKIDEYLTALCQQYAIHEKDVFDYAFKMGAQFIMKIINSGDDNKQNNPK